jgi:pimeloyl-ACP methyl ester carboxylesterase
VVSDGASRRLAVTRVGEGPRPVVLLHGFLGRSRNLGALARGLAGVDPRLSVVALDLPGHGASPPLPPDADLAVLARSVLDTARDVAGTAPLAIVGHSLGGRVALRACLLDPAAVALVGVLDITPSARHVSDDTLAALEALERAPAHADTREAFREHFHAAGLSPEMADWLMMNLARDGDGLGWRIERGALRPLAERTAREDLWPAIEGATAYARHCVRGARSGYVSDDDARRLVAAGCSVDTVDAGHWLHVERTADVVGLVGGWLT